MNEHFQFHRFGFPRHHELQLVQPDLTLQNDAPDAEFCRKIKPGGIVKPHLRGGVHCEFRKILPDHAENPEILHDQCVRPKFF